MAHNKKELFLNVFEKKAGNISMACKAVGIGRRTYYNWLDEDKTFRENIDNINESLIDFAESKLLLNIKAGKEASLFFYLKCKGKQRGYIERQSLAIEHKNKTVLEESIERLIENHGIGVINGILDKLRAEIDSDNT